MNTYWLLENYTRDFNSEEFGAELNRIGKFHFILNSQSNPFYIASLIPADSCVIYQGSIQTARKVKQAIPQTRVFCNEKQFECSSYYPKLQKHLFNNNYLITAFSLFKNDYWKYFQMFGFEAKIWVRPNSGMKPFTAQVLDLQDIEMFFENIEKYGILLDTDFVVISNPKEIIGEWRFVVDNQKNIISYSTYLYQGQLTLIPSAPIFAIEQCGDILSDGYFPDPVFVIDVCQGKDGKFWLLELNSFSHSNLYSCNKREIAEKVSLIAEKEFLENKNPVLA